MSGRATGEHWGAGAARLSGQITLLLGWTPDRFWAATPEELTTILGAVTQPGTVQGIDRRTLDAMMEHDRHG